VKFLADLHSHSQPCASSKDLTLEHRAGVYGATGSPWSARCVGSTWAEPAALSLRPALVTLTPTEPTDAGGRSLAARAHAER
jgi:hypothetical protein